jgi:hypothetical protein
MLDGQGVMPMKRRRAIAALAAAAVLAVAAAALWPADPRPRRAAFDRVRVGMDYPEVCAAAGGPPGDYSDGSCVHSGYRVEGDGVEWWLADDGELFVVFGPDGRAAAVSSGPAARYPRPPVWARLRARLGL